MASFSQRIWGICEPASEHTINYVWLDGERGERVGPPLRKAVIRAGLGSATLVGREGEGGEGGGGRMAVFSEVGR